MRDELSLEAVLSELAPRVLANTCSVRFGLRANRDKGRFPDRDKLELAVVAEWVASCGWLSLGELKGALSSKENWLQGGIEGLRYLLLMQHDNGLLDLYSCNYDSAPDTGFMVQRLAPVVDLAVEARAAEEDGQWRTFVDLTLQFIRRAVPGLLSGGFHTPNHRWVISSALACAHHLMPDLDVADVLEQYLAEGFDLDEDGAWIEHSVGVYDAVCDRSMLLLAERMDLPEALEAARRNLEFDYHMLNADGTGETGLSRRQDFGTRKVALGLAGPYLQCGKMVGDTTLQSIAVFLWDSAEDSGFDGFNWLIYAMLRYGLVDAVDGTQPSAQYIRHFAANGVWRMREGQLSVTAFTKSTRLLGLSYGSAELRSVKISQSYFGTGRFVGETLSVTDDCATLHFSGTTDRHRPGYDLPLGRPVAPDQWREMCKERSYRPLPPSAGDLVVRPAEKGIDLQYITRDGWHGVTGQIALDFVPGGIWESEDVCFKPEAGQVVFLKQGYGAMRYGDAVIEIGPGIHAHQIWAMRDAEPPNGLVRVLLTFETPVDHCITIRVHGL